MPTPPAQPGRATPAGRPAGHTRAEIVASAIAIADADGLDAVSMRRVAAGLGTGAASLYRYVAGRDELIDLMTDATGAEYELPAPDGDWLAGLTEVGRQARQIMRRHPWLAAQVSVGPPLGPHGLALLEYVLEVLAGHPAPAAAKVEAFAMLTALTALFVQNELAGGSQRQQRNAAYLQHALASGEHPRLAGLLAADPAAPAAEAPALAGDGGPAGRDELSGRYADLLRRVLTGLLGPDTRSARP